MIIDLILDRMEGCEYSAREFYWDVMQYESTFGMDRYISKAMDYGTEADVKKALCRYIREGEYNPDIMEYITSVDWLQ